MAFIRICDICESKKDVKVIGFQLSHHEDDYNEVDICDNCELRILRKFKNEIIESPLDPESKISKYYYINRMFELTKEIKGN